MNHTRPSTSSHAAAVLFARKKDGGLRLCVDSRGLNEKTVKDAFPLPRVDDLLVELREVNVITQLNLMQGYYQVRVAEEDVWKTAFQSPDGLYEFVVMSYGLTNAPATFQRQMNHVLAPVLHKFVIVYLDDICVYSLNSKEYLEHLRKVVELLRKKSLKLRLRKCTFAQTETIYLGLIVHPSTKVMHL